MESVASFWRGGEGFRGPDIREMQQRQNRKANLCMKTLFLVGKNLEGQRLSIIAVFLCPVHCCLDCGETFASSGFNCESLSIAAT